MFDENAQIEMFGTTLENLDLTIWRFIANNGFGKSEQACRNELAKSIMSDCQELLSGEFGTPNENADWIRQKLNCAKYILR